MSLKSQLSNLHLLLRVPSFARWPLGIRFFCEDVLEAWLKWSSEADAPLRRSINIHLDFNPSKEFLYSHPDLARSSFGGDSSNTVPRGLQSVDPTYNSMKAYVDKSQNIVHSVEKLTCCCCGNGIDASREMMLLCPESKCRAVSHMACLSGTFLRDAKLHEVVPIEGQCPSCRADLKWTQLVKELTLRMRGHKEIDRLLKPKRRKAGVTEACAENAREEYEGPEDDPEDDLSAEDVIDEPKKYEVSDACIEDSWETSSVSTVASEGVTNLNGESNLRYQYYNQQLSPVVEDSDGWEGVQVLD